MELLVVVAFSPEIQPRYGHISFPFRKGAWWTRLETSTSCLALGESRPLYPETAQLRAMYDGKLPVTARALAQAFGLLEGAIMPVLRRAEQAGMIQNFRCRGWIPLNR